MWYRTIHASKEPQLQRSRRAMVGLMASSGMLGSLVACTAESDVQSMEVTATAYTMRESETKKGNVGLTAWGDQLEPGMQTIAVSRDLIGLGLDHETPVRIEGLDGTFVVRDKMNRRWEEKIDIFMGTDVEQAREWGKREVTIYWSDDE